MKLMMWFLFAWPFVPMPAIAQSPAELPPAYALPAAKTDLEKLQLILAIQKEFPSFLTRSSDYGFDPFEVLEDQQRLLEILQRNPQYVPQLRRHHLELTIQENSERQLIRHTVDEEKIASWRRDLLEALAKDPDPVKGIAETITAIKGESAQNVLTGLIQKLDTNLKPQAFRQPSVAEKIRFLRETPGVPPDLKASLSRVEELLALEQRLKNLAELAIFAQTEAGKFLSTADLRAKIERLDKDSLNALSDHDHFVKPRHVAINERLRPQPNNMAVRTEVIAAIQKAAKDRLTPVVSGSETITRRELRLVELRPGAGIFRACTGGDCSTKHSFAAPNNPSEMIFDIRDADGNSKGYLEAAIVRVNRKPALYVSSINGARISADDVDLILHALAREQRAFGVEKIILPQASQIQPLVNYEPIQRRFQELIQGRRTLPIGFSDRAVRSQIENFESIYLSSDYDSMADNSRGVEFSPAGEAPALKTNVTSRELSALRLQTGVDRAQVLRLAIESEVANPEFTRRALGAIGISTEAYESLREASKNTLGLSVAEFQKSISSAVDTLVGRTGGAIPERFTALGYLRAPDALSSANFRDTERRLNLAFSAYQTHAADSNGIKEIAEALGELAPTPEKLLIAKGIIEKGDQKTLRALAKHTFSHPHAAQMQDLLRLMIEKGDWLVLANLAEHVFSQPHTAQMQDLLRLMIEKGDPGVLTSIVKHVFSQPHAVQMQDLLLRLIEKGDQSVLAYLPEHVFRAHAPQMQEPLRRLIARGDENVLERLAFYTFPHKRALEMQESLGLLIERGNNRVLMSLAAHTFSRPHAAQMQDLLIQLIEKGDQGVLSVLARYVFSSPHAALMEKPLRLFIEKVDDSYVLSELAQYALSQPHMADMAEIRALASDKAKVLADRSRSALNRSRLNSANCQPLFRQLKP